MIDTEFLHQLDRFSLIINKRITSNYVGERFSKATGRGLIFKDHSIYAPGEDFRSVDWRVFGRTDKLYVKRYEEERNLIVHIVLDNSASMNFGSGVSKAEYAGMLGVGFAYLALKNNERFVLSTFSDVLEVFKPRKGRAQLASMVEYLNSKKPKGLSKLDQCLGGYKKLLTSRSYVVIISDFLYPIEDIRRALMFFKNHRLVLIQVLDKVERNLDLEGDFRLKDLETHEVLRTYLNPFARKQYSGMLQEHIDKIQRTCDEVGAQFYSSHTGQSVFDVFYDVLGRRR
ncbi:DUF58 domain-containing protein [Candidatus Woesearchaeota archaeon]|nr:DUF58 domain-containing protein [Candidatus Woesearchaeota archaeon]MBW3016028.1 DUF58 domain-containing protein [Candidatus Woesearchaeota archaeon]